jgi:hypothetical protein
MLFRKPPVILSESQLRHVRRKLANDSDGAAFAKNQAEAFFYFSLSKGSLQSSKPFVDVQKVLI